MNCVLLLSLALFASAKIIDVMPSPDFVNWDEAKYDNIDLNVGDSIRFSTEWRAHNVFMSINPGHADRDAFKACNGPYIDAHWTKISCDCPGLSPTLEAIGLGACEHGTSGAGTCAGSDQVFPATFVPIVGDLVFTLSQAGTYYFVCTAEGGGHCMKGMHFKVDVHSVSHQRGHQAKTVGAPLDTSQSIWSFFVYHDIKAKVGDKLRFFYETEHNVGQWNSATTPDFSPAAMPSACDLDTWTVVGDNNAGSTSTGFVTAPLTLGDHWFSCRTPGHCDVGMHVRAHVTSGEGEGEHKHSNKGGEGEGHH